jgi:hypothetical protein
MDASKGSRALLGSPLEYMDVKEVSRDMLGNLVTCEDAFFRIYSLE